VKGNIDETRPIFQQIKETIEDAIIDGTIGEGKQVPSTNEFASFYQINPATAAKGVNFLVEEGVLFKKRGLGMFVAEGARKKLLEKRKREFSEKHIDPLLEEAKRLGLSRRELIDMIERNGGI